MENYNNFKKRDTPTQNTEKEQDIETGRENTPEEVSVFMKTIGTEVVSGINLADQIIELGQKRTELISEKSTKDIEPIQEEIKKTKNKFMKRLGDYIPLMLVALTMNAKEPLQNYNENSFNKKEKAKKELMANGITSEQQQAYKPGISELLNRGIRPFGYQEDFNRVFSNENTTWQKIIEKSGVKNKGAIENLASNIIFGWDKDESNVVRVKNRKDAWGLYLGLPQKYNTFEISDYKPEKSKENKYYYKINSFVDNLQEKFEQNKGINEISMNMNHEKYKKIIETAKNLKTETRKEYLRNYFRSLSPKERESCPNFYLLPTNTKEYAEELNNNFPLSDYEFTQCRADVFREKGEWDEGDEKYFTNLCSIIKHNNGKRVIDKDGDPGIMGDYTVSAGEDEKGHYISYYDKWNLEKSLEGEEGFLGKPYEIYDRIYYDQETGEKIELKTAQ